MLNHNHTINNDHVVSTNDDLGLEYQYSSGATHSDGDLDELKQFLRVQHAEDDYLLDDYLDSAIEDIESLTGQTLINREVSAYWRKAGDCVELPRYPIVSVIDVSRVDNEGNKTSLTDYTEYTSPDFNGRLILQGIGSGSQLSVMYQAGMAQNFIDLPTRLQKACFHQVRLYYDKTPLNDSLQIKQPEGIVWQAWRLASQFIDKTDF